MSVCEAGERVCVCVEKMGEREKRLHNEPVVARVKIMCVTHDDGKNGIFFFAAATFCRELFVFCVSFSFLFKDKNNL